MALSQLPVSVMEATLFCGIIYFMVGFHQSTVFFFIFWGVVASCNLCLSALFRYVLSVVCWRLCTPLLRRETCLEGMRALVGEGLCGKHQHHQTCCFQSESVMPVLPMDMTGPFLLHMLPPSTTNPRFLAVLAPNPTLAAAYGGIALLILILTSGFAIVRGSIPVYWIWAYYISPVSSVWD